jgi:hypothetical protein
MSIWTSFLRQVNSSCVSKCGRSKWSLASRKLFKLFYAQKAWGLPVWAFFTIESPSKADIP